MTDDETFISFLKLLANNSKDGYIQEITWDGRPQQYGFNLENNNHWHDIVNLIKEFINNRGKNINKESYSRLIFNWNNGGRTTLYDKKIIHDMKDNIEVAINSIEKEKAIQNKIALLKYKHQIILQGPPGTGKTRMAKELASIITKKNKSNILDNNFILRNLYIGLRIKGEYKNYYEIVEIKGNQIIAKNNKENPYSSNVDTILERINNNLLDQNDGGKVILNAIGKFILNKFNAENNNVNDVQIIQFHPSYTYEDFVRGIVSKPNENGEGVLFETENKTLGKFAEKALKNLKDSKKGATELSKEKWLNEQFEKFIFYISEKLEKEEKIELTESVYIVELDEDAFRYKGLKGWNKKGNRMLFKDIKQAYLDENYERQDIKHNQNLSGLAKWHASYYIRVLDMFKDFLNDENSIFVANTSEKEDLKNYVLIIDEINRANLSSVLGELIYALEYRDKPVNSMYAIDNNNKIILPENLYIIGTMNTADRSVGHIDYAIRRRFAFVDVLPTIDPIGEKAKEKFKTVCSLFIENFDEVNWNEPIFIPSKHLSSDFKPEEVMLGHSYFITKENADDDNIPDENKQIELKLKYEVVPILKEYVKDGILIENDEVKKIINGLVS